MVSIIANFLYALDNVFHRIIRISPVVGKRRTNKHNIPLPEICHLEVDESLIQNRRMFVIGDVHGCFDEMVELMHKARTIDSSVLFTFVGDLVNKGPKSVEVLRHLRGLGFYHTVWSVRGNHDEGAIREVLRYREHADYELPERYQWVKDMDDDDIEFLMELPYTISFPSLNAHVVHAGIVPNRFLECQDLNNLTNMRNIIRERDTFGFTEFVGTNRAQEGEAWATVWSGPEHVYFGHDAKRKLQVREFATGLDTGCCYGGELTGVFITGKKKFLSVKSKQPPSSDYV